MRIAYLKGALLMVEWKVLNVDCTGDGVDGGMADFDRSVAIDGTGGAHGR